MAKKKGDFLKRLAKTTGTTTGEARGIMKGARKDVAAGKMHKAERTITKALAGGKSAGVSRSSSRTAKAVNTASNKVSTIATRQERKATPPSPKRSKKGESDLGKRLPKAHKKYVTRKKSV